MANAGFLSNLDLCAWLALYERRNGMLSDVDEKIAVSKCTSYVNYR